MIMRTSLPLKDLAAKTASASPGRSRTCGADRDDEIGAQQGRSMEFKTLGLDPQTTSEPDQLYTEADLARAVEDARRAAALETEAAVCAAMAEDIERRRCDMLAALNDQFELHGKAFDEEIARLAVVSHRLAIALAKAVIPRAIERQPLVDIADVLKATLAGLTAAPAMELRLHPSLVESGEVLIRELVQNTSFAGEITTIPDAALGAGDAELRWKSGAVSRRLSRLQAKALELADHWLADLSIIEDEEGHASCAVSAELATSNGLSGQANEKDDPNE